MIWGMPAVNADLMLQDMLATTKAKPNDIVYWSRPVRLEEPDADAQSRCDLSHVRSGT